MSMPFVSINTLLFLWQASWMTAGILAFTLFLLHFVRDAKQRANLLHAALLCCGATVIASALLPHFILLPQRLPLGMPLVDHAESTADVLPPTLRYLCLAVMALWLGGCAVKIIQIIYGWFCVRRLLDLSAPLESSRLSHLLDRIGPIRNLDLRVLPTLDAPFCWQIHRPVLVLSESILHKSDADLELLLRHEIAHLKFGDPLRLFVEHCLLAVLWFHPLIHYVQRQAQCWREIASDDWALAGGGAPRQLARLLTELAEQATRTRASAWQLSARGAAGDWHFRVMRLVESRESPAAASGLRQLAIPVLIALALVLAVVRIGGPHATPTPMSWTHWPRPAARLLDLLGVQVVDFDLHRAAHDPREQSPLHRAAHRTVRNR